MTNPITFKASFPAIASAIIISGDGNGLRIKLDIPETELMQALSLLAMHGAKIKAAIVIAASRMAMASHVFIRTALDK